jgi:hypothetical protein
MKLDFEEGQMHSVDGKRIGIAAHEGILYVFSDHHLLFHRPVVLNRTTRRPSSTVVLGAIMQVLLEANHRRPLSVFLGQPSICSRADVPVYEDALDGSIVRDYCTMAMRDTLEATLKDTYLPYWRSNGMLDYD